MMIRRLVSVSVLALLVAAAAASDGPRGTYSLVRARAAAPALPSMPWAKAARRPTPTPVARPTARAAAASHRRLAPTSGAMQLGEAKFSLFTFDPWFTKQQVWFTLSAPARVSIRITPTGQVTHVRTMDLGVRPAGTVQVSWDGLDNAHKRVPEGNYTYTITATNAKGKQQSETYNMLGVTYKRILISLSKQQLWAFDGFHYVLSTLVTTGNPALPTPTGDFPILAKYSPFTFVSPWPVGSEYYYAPSPVTYAMLFDDRGYYVHDSPWRSAYGPGTNATLGTPGLNYTGSHGCVNVPFVTMQQLFQWATIGTEVQVVP